LDVRVVHVTLDVRRLLGGVDRLVRVVKRSGSSGVSLDVVSLISLPVVVRLPAVVVGVVGVVAIL
jgi:hypothetical protein